MGNKLNMKKFGLTIVLISSVVWSVYCISRFKQKGETIQKINRRTGVAIVADHLIQKYEKEHRKFYEEEIGDGNYLEWPALESKNLSEYCRNFLEHSIPERNTNIVIGSKIRRLLHYEKENLSFTSNIIIVQCKVKLRYSCFYYITRALEPNCVYSVSHTHNGGRNKKFIIIHKYCDFEERSLKRKRVEIVDKIHFTTGQPIAKDDYLLEYELEHWEFLRKERGKCIEWQYAMLHASLDSYCYQYIAECVPGRKRKGVTGSWKTENLQYQKLNTNESSEVVTVTCVPPYAVKRQYYITRAPETNCVYALLRNGHNVCSPLFIVFKHCNFEHSNDKLITSRDYNTLEQNVFPNTDVKERISDIF